MTTRAPETLYSVELGHGQHIHFAKQFHNSYSSSSECTGTASFYWGSKQVREGAARAQSRLAGPWLGERARLAQWLQTGDCLPFMNHNYKQRRERCSTTRLTLDPVNCPRHRRGGLRARILHRQSVIVEECHAQVRTSTRRASLVCSLHPTTPVYR